MVYLSHLLWPQCFKLGIGILSSLEEELAMSDGAEASHCCVNTDIADEQQHHDKLCQVSLHGHDVLQCS
jgi:hypothetical protein